MRVPVEGLTPSSAEMSAMGCGERAASPTMARLADSSASTRSSQPAGTSGGAVVVCMEQLLLAAGSGIAVRRARNGHRSLPVPDRRIQRIGGYATDEIAPLPNPYDAHRGVDPDLPGQDHRTPGRRVADH